MLSFDICRCRGEQCAIRECCSRYLDRNTGHVRTPQVATLRDSPDTCAFQILPADVGQLESGQQNDTFCIP